MELIKKAFIVWHDGMINDNPNEGYRINELPIIYADTPGEAKSLATEPYDWTLHDQEPQYTDLKVRRAANADKMLFEGNEYTRRRIIIIKTDRKRITKRRKLIENYPEGTYFYIQNTKHGYVGNSVLWWGKKSNGYTTDSTTVKVYPSCNRITYICDRCGKEITEKEPERRVVIWRKEE